MTKPLASQLAMIYFLFGLLRIAAAAPVQSVGAQLRAAQGNRTLLNTEFGPAWASSPDYRGSTDILWSCILTLVACIYNAIHLNIPSKHEGLWRSTLHKFQWVAISLFAPELVLFTAFTQFLEARKIVSELNRLRVDGKAGKEGLNNTDPEEARPESERKELPKNSVSLRPDIDT